MSITPFCPQCQRYLALQPVCPCGWVRPATWAASPQAICHAGAAVSCPPLGLGADRLGFRFGAQAPEPVGGLLVLDASAGGRPSWQHRYTLPLAVNTAPQAPLALLPDGSSIVLAQEDGHVLALSVADGRPRWAQSLSLHGDLVEAGVALPTNLDLPRSFVVSQTGQLHMFDWRSGHSTHLWSLGSPAANTVRAAATPLRVGGGLLIGVFEEERLARSYAKRNTVRVYFCRNIDTSTPDPIEIYHTSPARLYANPIWLGPNDPHAVLLGLYLDPKDYKQQPLPAALVRLDTQSGHATPLPNTPALPKVRATPCYADGALYVPSEHHVYKLDARDGRPLWSRPYQHDHSLNAPPLVADGLVFCADNSSRVFALDADTGQKIWQFDLSRAGEPAGTAAVYGGFALQAGALWFGAQNGIIYAMQPHADQWSWAEQRATRQKNWRAVAAYKLQAAPNDQLSLAEWLERHEQFEDAAKVFLAISRKTQAAECYRKAAQQSKHPDLWENAAVWFEHLGHSSVANTCYEQVAITRKQPLVRIRLCEGGNLPQVGSPSLLQIEVSNHNQAVMARNVEIEVTGDDLLPTSVISIEEVIYGHPCLRNIKIDPRRSGDIQVQLQVTCNDANNSPVPDRRWHNTLRALPKGEAPVQYHTHIGNYFAASSEVLTVQGDVGMIKGR